MPVQIANCTVARAGAGDDILRLAPMHVHLPQLMDAFVQAMQPCTMQQPAASRRTWHLQAAVAGCWLSPLG